MSEYIDTLNINDVDYDIKDSGALHQSDVAAVATSGSYSDLTNKPKINNVDLTGNKTAAQLGLQTELTIDATPTEDSTNPVQSGGVYDALGNLYQALSVAENCLFGGLVSRLDSPSQGDDHRYYYITQQVGYFPNFDVTIANNDPNAVMIYWNDILSRWVVVALWPKISYVDGKADKVSGATQGNLAGLDSDGDLTDSGKSPSDFATAAQGGKADTAVQPSDLATVATSGSYNDLLNKPTIPAAQVNSDWNANSGVAQILNKPTIPAAQVQSDWNEADNTKVDYIKNKPTIPNVSGKADKVVGATSGDVATLDANGNLTDSGKKASDFATPIPVVNVSTVPASMDADKFYDYGTLSADIIFPSLNTPSDATNAHVFWWTFKVPATAPNVGWPASGITEWSGGSPPDINASTTYEIMVNNGFASYIMST